MILVLDNYDSFTYNLVQYLGHLGAEPVVRRNDPITVAGVRSLRTRSSSHPGRECRALLAVTVVP